MDFFLKILFLSFFSPKAPQYIVVYSSLWVPLVVACGTLPQRGLTSSAMSAPRIRTDETLGRLQRSAQTDRKSTRLNSSHANISYAVFCLKKKKDIYYIKSVV